MAPRFSRRRRDREETGGGSSDEDYARLDGDEHAWWAQRDIAALAPVEAEDPYEVLEIDPSATWEEIVEAHRRMARHHHPDRLVGRAAAEIVAGEDRIRAINAAYAELKVRRGR